MMPASSFCPFAPVENFLVAKVNVGERRRCGDVRHVFMSCWSQRWEHHA